MAREHVAWRGAGQIGDHEPRRRHPDHRGLQVLAERERDQARRQREAFPHPFELRPVAADDVNPATVRRGIGPRTSAPALSAH